MHTVVVGEATSALAAGLPCASVVGACLGRLAPSQHFVSVMRSQRGAGLPGAVDFYHPLAVVVVFVGVVVIVAVDSEKVKCYLAPAPGRLIINAESVWSRSTMRATPGPRATCEKRTNRCVSALSVANAILLVVDILLEVL